MSNAILSLLLLLLFFLSVTAQSPSPSPSPSRSIHAPNPTPAISPLSPSAPAPSPGSSQAPAPSPMESMNHVGMDSDERAETSSRGGLSRNKKAGLAMGVIVAASVMVLAGMVYKKRKQNIRRSQYSYPAREFL